jgi:hypothetical protein
MEIEEKRKEKGATEARLIRHHEEEHENGI